jgi:simple sugar transport system permease protein
VKLRIHRKYVPLLATIGVFLAVFVAGGIQYRDFFTLVVFANLFKNSSFVGLCAVGMTFVIISGGIDLSVGAMVAFASTLIAWLTGMHGVPAYLAIGLVLLIGVVFGLAQGSMIQLFKAPAFIVTLAGMFLLRGLGFVINLASVPVEDPVLVALNGFSVPLGFDAYLSFGACVLIVAVIVSAIVLGRTKFGRNVYAVGGSEQSVLLMGIPLVRMKLAIYAVSGFFSALAGIVFAVDLTAGDPSAAVGLELDAIAAVVIGGTLLTGGFGFVMGSLVGVLIQQIIQTILAYQGNLNAAWTRIVVGALLLVFILLQRFFSQGTAAGRATARRRTQPPRLTPVAEPKPRPARIGAEKP